MKRLYDLGNPGISDALKYFPIKWVLMGRGKGKGKKPCDEVIDEVVKSAKKGEVGGCKGED